MLYRNDEGPIKLNDAEIKEIEKHFHGKFPVKVIYPPERITPSRLKHNRKPDKPNSISFDFKSTVKTPKGTEVWRYAENVVVSDKGVRKYTPKKFIYNGVKSLKRNDIELIYFLLNKSEYCKGGKNEGPMVKFMFEDIISEAEKRAEKKQLETKINGLLYGEDFGLPEEKLRAVAEAYWIPNVNSLTLPQVKWQLENKITETKEGPDEFLRMVDADEEIKTRLSIQNAKDTGVLKYDNVKNTWNWQTTGEKGQTQICKVPPTESANEALYKFYLGNEGFRDDLQAVLLTKKPKTKDKNEE